MEIVFLVPMKGHSERVHDKNMKSFNGFPLYHSVLKSILNSKYPKRILINTDSERISEDVRKNFSEVEIIDRPLYLRGDEVSMNKIISHDIALSGAEHFFQTHSTNPLLDVKIIDEAISFYFGHLEQYDSVFSVTKIQSRLYDEKAKALNHDPNDLIRTQDLSPLYEENSNFYIFSKTTFLANGEKRIGHTPYMFETPPNESIDIDIESDFLLAEQLYRILKKTQYL